MSDHIIAPCESLKCENGVSVEHAETGTPPGFFITNTPATAPENSTQISMLQSLATTEAAPGGDEKPPPSPAAPTLHELIPELPSPSPMSRGGRPSVLTPQTKEQLCILLSLGLSRRHAAAYLDIAATTISHAMERDADFARGIDRAEELRVVGPLLKVVAESRRSWRAAAWLLERAARSSAPSAEQRHEQHQIRIENIHREAEVVRVQQEVDEQLVREKHSRDEALQRQLRLEEKARRAQRAPYNAPPRASG